MTSIKKLNILMADDSSQHAQFDRFMRFVADHHVQPVLQGLEVIFYLLGTDLFCLYWGLFPHLIRLGTGQVFTVLGELPKSNLLDFEVFCAYLSNFIKGSFNVSALHNWSRKIFPKISALFLGIFVGIIYLSQ